MCEETCEETSEGTASPMGPKDVSRVFVYEYLSGGGTIEGDPAAEDELMPLGLSMRDAMLGDLLGCGLRTVSVATCARAADVPAAAAAVQQAPGESPLAFVARQAALHDLCWVVAPETAGLLAAFQEAVGPARWLGCDQRAIALTARKRATLLHLSAHGIATPLAFEHAPEVTRWVVKPDDGAGAVDTRVHRLQDDAIADWKQRARRGAASAIEPWVDGEALSLSLLCGASGMQLLSVNRQHIGLDAQGALSFDGVDLNVIAPSDRRHAALQAIARRVAEAIPGLAGFVGIDLVWHARCGPVVIEVNPRVTCAYVGLSAALGRNLAVELLRSRTPNPGFEVARSHA